MKNPKATTLQFESDFDFETANAQFKDDLTKEVVGVFISEHISHFSGHNIKLCFLGVHVYSVPPSFVNCCSGKGGHCRGLRQSGYGGGGNSG